jgi:hypothetical protein
MEGTSVTSIEVANSIPANYIGPPNRGDLSAFLGRVGHIDVTSTDASKAAGPIVGGP